MKIIFSIATRAIRGALVVSGLWIFATYAQEAKGSERPDEGHESMQHESMQGMKHNTMPNMGDGDMAMPMPDMDHIRMQMQGGAAPADARDPDAYGEGLSRSDGPYTINGMRLRLDDEKSMGGVMFQRLEYARSTDDNIGQYELQAHYGRDFDRMVVKSEGEFARKKLQDSRNEVLWGHAIAPYWDSQIGFRFDHGAGPDRQWLAFGVEGIAPYWFDSEVTAYLGTAGRTALRLTADYEVLLTQRWAVVPRVEFNAYGADDPAHHIGRGIADGVFGMRLSYAVSPQWMPYVGVEWSWKFAKTANMARDDGERTRETVGVVGMRLWF